MPESSTSVSRDSLYSTAPVFSSKAHSRVSAWPISPKDTCSRISQGENLSAFFPTGVLPFPATISIILAVANLRQHSRCWSSEGRVGRLACADALTFRIFAFGLESEASI
jgi:hypothetical protein